MQAARRNTRPEFDITALMPNVSSELSVTNTAKLRELKTLAITELPYGQLFAAD